MSKLIPWSIEVKYRDGDATMRLMSIYGETNGRTFSVCPDWIAENTGFVPLTKFKLDILAGISAQVKALEKICDCEVLVVMEYGSTEVMISTEDESITAKHLATVFTDMISTENKQTKESQDA